jgi:hypothetical protein
MKCHWTELDQGYYIRVETSCGGAWGKSKADTFTTCPECDCEIARGERPTEVSTKRLRFWEPEKKPPATIAGSMPEYEWKIQESYRLAAATRDAMRLLYACPVPKGCNGPNLCDYDGVYASYELPTFGTVPCRFHNPMCNYAVRERARIELQNKPRSV